MPMVWLKGVDVNDVFRFTVIVDVAEDDRLCTPAENNMPPPPPGLWNEAAAAGEAYFFLVGDGAAHAVTIGDAWADKEGTFARTSVDDDIAFMNGASGAGSELDSALREEAPWGAGAPVDDALLGVLRVGEDRAYESVLDKRSLDEDLVGEEAPTNETALVAEARLRAFVGV